MAVVVELTKKTIYTNWRNIEWVLILKVVWLRTVKMLSLLLKQWIRQSKSFIENKTGEKGYSVNLIEGFRLPTFEISTYFDMVTCSFSYVGEQRKLSLIFCCDCDLKNHEEIKGEKCIWLSLGSWGSSVEIMKVILKELSSIGECYIDESDADDYGFVKV